MKKGIAFLLTLALLLGMSISALAADTVISVNAPTTMPKAGETFTVTVDISGNPGLCAVQFTLGFDKSLMQCTGANTGEVLRGMMTATNENGKNGAVIAAAATDEKTGNGTLASFTFTAEKDVTAWAFTLSKTVLSGKDGSGVSFSLTNAELVKEETASETTDASDTQESSGDDPAEEPTEETDADDEETSEESGYPDVLRADAAYVAYATEKGLFQGYADGTFRPDNPVTRGAYVAVLWRLAGKPSASEAEFSDIADCNEDFRKAIAWASSQGLIDGYADGTFRPGASVSRRAALKILYQYNGGVNDMNPMYRTIYENAFTDAASLSAAFKDPVYWGRYHKLIAEDSETSLGVARSATRAELARIFAVYAELAEREHTI